YKLRSPAGGKVDGVQPVYLDREFAEGSRVNLHRNDEAVVLELLLERIGDRQLIERAGAVWVHARLGHDEDRLASVMPEGLFDRAPERVTALQLKKVGPNLVPVTGESRAEPPNEVVIVRSGVAHEHRVAGHGDRSIALGSVRLPWFPGPPAR